jgi:hypothetical protein
VMRGGWRRQTRRQRGLSCLQLLLLCAAVFFFGPGTDALWVWNPPSLDSSRDSVNNNATAPPLYYPSPEFHFNRNFNVTGSLIVFPESLVRVALSARWPCETTLATWVDDVLGGGDNAGNTNGGGSVSGLIVLTPPSSELRCGTCAIAQFLQRRGAMGLVEAAELIEGQLTSAFSGTFRGGQSDVPVRNVFRRVRSRPCVCRASFSRTSCSFPPSPCGCACSRAPTMTTKTNSHD